MRKRHEQITRRFMAIDRTRNAQIISGFGASKYFDETKRNWNETY